MHVGPTFRAVGGCEMRFAAAPAADPTTARALRSYSWSQRGREVEDITIGTVIDGESAGRRAGRGTVAAPRKPGQLLARPESRFASRMGTDGEVGAAISREPDVLEEAHNLRAQCSMYLNLGAGLGPRPVGGWVRTSAVQGEALSQAAQGRRFTPHAADSVGLLEDREG